MEKASRKKVRKNKNEKENAEPPLQEDSDPNKNPNNAILETIFADINNVVGRRSTMGKRSLCLKDIDESIIDADDEKEKRERKQKEEAEKEKLEKNAENIKKTGINILNNLTPAELEEHYSKCIQLCNQNKVSVKNAFKLQLIDYMKLICMKQPSKTENLTLMGCTLGASAKIYSHRVDKVYTDMVKILSGKEIEMEKEETDEVVEDKLLNEVKYLETQSDEENDKLEKFDLDKMLLPEKSLDKKKTENQPQEKPTLPVGIDYFLDCPVQDVDCKISLNPIIFSTNDVVQNNNTLFLTESYYNGNYDRLDPCPFIRDYKELHKYFNVLGEMQVDEELMNSSLKFDPSSRIELPDNLRLDADDPEVDCSDGAVPECWGMDYDEEYLPEPEPNLRDDKLGQISVSQPKSFSAPNMAQLVSSKSSDYSFFDNSRLDLWAGPSHWTIKRVKDGEKEHKVTGAIPKKPVKKKNLELNMTSFRETKKLYADVESSTLARKTMLTWSKSRCKFPCWDISTTQKNLFSLLKNKELLFVKKDKQTNLLCSASLNDDTEEELLTPEDFCGNTSHIDDDRYDDTDHCNGAFETEARDSVSPLREQDAQDAGINFELLPAPPKVNKLTINYAKVQKRIDMKLLKNTIWDSMALKETKETRENPVKFSDVFTSLPSKLPKEEAAELSFPIAFMALLHMANEKNLSLKGTDNHDDVYVSLE